MEWQDIKVPQHPYAYTQPIIIKKWSTGHIIAKVGYVREHPEVNNICLEKVYKVAGGKEEKQEYNIKKGDWSAIKEAIDKLLPEIGDSPTSDGIDSAVHKLSQEKELLEIIAQYPELLNQLPKNIDILSLPEDQKEALRQFLSTGGSIANEVIRKLALEPIQDLSDFSKLLDDLKLSTINSLVTHVKGRVGIINMFEKVILSDNSYERRGDDSVHSLLRANMWLIDRNYTILHDDQTLKNIIYNQWEKENNEKDLNKRPDFLCMSDRLNQEEGYKKLVIIEIKKPTITINMEHVQQAMRYKTQLQKYSGKSGAHFICYIIGRNINEDLRLSPLHDSGFITKTYSEFIGDARKFYHDYLEIIKSEKYSF